MVARAIARYIRISPFKVRTVIPLIKKRKIPEALAILTVTNKKAALILKKLLNSAVANAKNKGFTEEELVIERVVANPGPIYKRYHAASFGRASMIRKRTSHIILELDTVEKEVVSTKIKK